MLNCDGAYLSPSCAPAHEGERYAQEIDREGEERRRAKEEDSERERERERTGGLEGGMKGGRLHL